MSKARRSLPILTLLLVTPASPARTVRAQASPAQSGLSQPASRHRILFVDGSATGLSTGLSWADAFHHPQDALAVSQPGTAIWVAQGTYDPDPGTQPPFDHTATFLIPDGVQMYGGFAGGESSLAQRDPVAHPTLLTGDQLGDDIYGSAFNMGFDNVDHIVTMQAASPSTRLDGFQIIGAFVNRGPGLNLISGSPTIANCEFSWCAALDGGAVYAAGGGAPTFVGCSFHDCFASSGIGGGAIYFEAGATPLLLDCTFVDNHAPGGQGAGLGTVYCESATSLQVDGCDFRTGTVREGGAIAFFGTQLQVTNTSFTSNVASYRGGAILNDGGQVTISGSSFTGNNGQFRGAALHNQTGSMTVIDSTFTQNTSSFGAGGVEVLSGSLILEDCSFMGNWGATGGAVHVEAASMLARGSLFCANQSANGGAIDGTAAALSLSIRSCVFANNLATSSGGAVRSLGALSMLGCTLYGNQALDHYGGVKGISSDQVSGSILWANHDTAFGDIGRAQVRGPSVSYCCVQNLLVPPPGEDPINPANFPGSIDLDPLFSNPLLLDFNLQASSPCIDAGDNLVWPVSEVNDFDGSPRFIDVVTVPDTGVGPAPIVDMGAQEASQ